MVIDDFEELGSRGRNGEAAFGDVQQIIKFAYKKETAYYDLNDAKGELMRLRFYGVKVITNTQGVDEIVGSRMFKIATRTKLVGGIHEG